MRHTMVALVLSVVAYAPARADTIALANPGFEQPELGDGHWNGNNAVGSVAGWRIVAGENSFTGVKNSGNAEYSGTSGDNPGALLSPADGRQFAFVGEIDVASIPQSLGAVLLPDTDYKLTVALGNRKDQLRPAGIESAPNASLVPR